MPSLKLFGSAADDQEYAKALRAIGRDLANSFPENLEIELVGKNYKVQYHKRAKAPAETRTAKTGPLQKLFTKSAAEGPTPAAALLVPESCTYTPEQIESIYAVQTTGRKVADANPDIYDLGERLRTVGRMIDRIQGRLLRVAKHANAIHFQYSDAKGAVHSEELSNPDLYRLQKEFLAARQKHHGGDIWGEQPR